MQRSSLAKQVIVECGLSPLLFDRHRRRHRDRVITSNRGIPITLLFHVLTLIECLTKNQPMTISKSPGSSYYGPIVNNKAII